MYFHESPLFQEALVGAQAFFGIPSEIIEKDYYSMMLLRQITDRCPFLVLKGGTSLSKCFHAIRRFSEDLDLGIETVLTQSQKRRVKRVIEDAVFHLGLIHANPEQIRSRRDYNRYLVDYVPTQKVGFIKTHVVIETYFPVRVFPISRLPVQSFIGEFLVSQGRDDEVSAFQLGPFVVSVQTIERTLVDKLFALGDYFLSNRIEEHSRHIYDLNQILPRVDLNQVRQLIPVVRNERKEHSPDCLSAGDGINMDDIFTTIIERKTFQSDYNEITLQLLYSPVSYKEAIRTLEIIVQNHLFSQ